LRMNSEMSCAVMGATRMPLRKWPVAKKRLGISPRPRMGR
jgi:hypothetical protein